MIPPVTLYAAPDCPTPESGKKMLEFQKIRRLLSCTRRALDDYGMISANDRIAVGLSGGKDSLALLCALASLRRFYPLPYTLTAVTLDMGFPGGDFTPLRDFCEKLEVPFELIPTQLGHVIFEERKEKNPCSLCARMRRGILHDKTLALGCNKLALGHHFDDVLETFLLNLIHEGRLGTFSPVTYLSRKQLTVIRPMIYAQEKDIRYFASHSGLPVMESLCPANHVTQRETMKQMLTSLEREHHGLKHRMFGAICKAELDGYHTASAPCTASKKGEPEE